MRNLVIYDDNGTILRVKGGIPEPKEPVGVPFLWVEMPQGKKIKELDGIGVDVSVTPHKVILDDIPKTEVELLKEQLIATQQAVDFLLLGGM